MKKILATTLLGLTLLSCGRSKLSDSIPIKSLGEITSIDEDSFAIGMGNRGANFEFENIRIKDLDGKTNKFILPGPSNYEVGDKVTFEYYPKSRISYKELLEIDKVGSTIPLQKGYFDIKGIIKR